MQAGYLAQAAQPHAAGSVRLSSLRGGAKLRDYKWWPFAQVHLAVFLAHVVLNEQVASCSASASNAQVIVKVFRASSGARGDIEPALRPDSASVYAAVHPLCCPDVESGESKNQS